MDQIFIGIVDDGKFRLLSPRRAIPGGVRLTNIAVQEARPPDSGEPNLSKYEGNPIAVQGHDQVWREQGGREEIVDVSPGTCITIPRGTHFQFRTTGDEPLCFIIATMPPWPGEREAVRVQDHWKVK